MRNIVFNKNKIDELSKILENASDEIYRNLNAIDKSLELLPESFNDLKSKKMCDEIINNNIIVLKDYCGRLLNVQKFLNKISNAYDNLDNENE